MFKKSLNEIQAMVLSALKLRLNTVDLIQVLCECSLNGPENYWDQDYKCMLFYVCSSPDKWVQEYCP